MSAPTTGLGAAEPEEVGLSSKGLDRVDAAGRRKIDEGVIAGAVTLVARHGEIVRLRAMGLDRRFPRRPMRTDTIFRIFSMTKPVTGLAMGILADPVHPPTMRELMTHTAGFTYGRDRSELVGRRYSISMDLQGAVIERLSGQSLPGFLREHIVEPLRRRAALYCTGGPLRLLPVPNRRSAVAPPSGTVRPAPGSGSILSTTSSTSA
ncbi:serine hydrolase domain-containing protein [Nonomuraea sp. LP-02]|uniref:serine hydrolase domain-containing protein n=1 Tax=Nonomuraea sp. LP-02 TaxID=3097960 RepID=UPI002E346ED6|nr:serine hydrolase domain-containing protein [Nonomuraea sp. LP-02]MED7931832.1 serine hydrolase domain-containing protein [Nonomuraea sp. LP-02]